MKYGVPLSTVILASNSPRRREIMSGVKNRVESVSPDVAEGPAKAGETVAKYVARLAAEKAASIPDTVSGDVILAGDTVIAIDNRVFGKPRSGVEATAMLLALRDRPHSVLTGVAVQDSCTGESLIDVKESIVQMRGYSPKEIERYVRTNTPLDRAGAYGIQDDDFSPVKSLEGCYLNVVGLPICIVVVLLTQIGARVALRPRCSVPYLANCVSCDLDTQLYGENP